MRSGSAQSMLTWISIDHLSGSASSRCRSRFSSEIVENWRNRSRSPGRRVLTDFGRQARQREAEAHRADRDAVLLGRARDARRRDADVGAEHTLRAFGHLARRVLAHDRLGRDAEHRALHVGRVRADRAAEHVARAGHVDDARADQPAGQRLGDAERPARGRAAVRAPRDSIVSSSTPNTRSPRIARNSFSSASTSARASASVAALAVTRTTSPSMPRARNAIVGIAALRVERVEAVRDHLRERRLRRAPRLQRARHDRRRFARTPQQVGDDVLASPSAASRTARPAPRTRPCRPAARTAAPARCRSGSGSRRRPRGCRPGAGCSAACRAAAARNIVAIVLGELHVADERRRPSARRSRRGSGRPGSGRGRRR